MKTIVVSGLALALQALAVSAQNKDFLTDCNSVALDSGDMLSANCQTGSSDSSTASAHTSTIDLNLCVGVDHTDGALAWSVYGKYTLYCGDCSLLQPATLNCSCGAGLDGPRKQTTLDLNTGIGNKAGKLQCMGGGGN